MKGNHMRSTKTLGVTLSRPASQQFSLATIFAALLAIAALPAITSATIIYDTPGEVFTENFDGPAEGASTVSWVDDTTVPHWFAYEPENNAPVAQLRTTSAGSSTSGGILQVLYRWRENASATDFAFGTKPKTDSGALMIAMRLQNNTGITLTEFTLGYTGEQWYHATGGNNQLVVSYQIGSPATLEDGTWTPIDDLVFNSPKEDATSSADLNGNDAGNFVVLAPQTVNGISWAPGEFLYIRWFDNDSSGVDQALAVDDLTFSANSNIPEPGSVVLLGLGTALIFSKRRSSRNH